MGWKSKPVAALLAASLAWSCADSPTTPDSLETPIAASVSALETVRINEIRTDQPSTDLDEYFELAGPAGAALDDLTYLVIGDGTGGSGVVEAVVTLSGQVLDADGIFLAAEASFTLATADFTTSLNFENSDNVTHLLVRNFTGSSNDDLDTDDDGVLDATPWTEVLDCAALRASATSGEFVYCAVQLGPVAGAPVHVYRDATDAWQVGSEAVGAATETPGAPNSGDGGGGGPGPDPDPDPEPEAPTALLIGELRADQDGTDNDEYFELNAPAGTSLAGLTWIAIGDGTGGSGVIEAVAPLGNVTVPASGTWLVAEGTFTLGTADATANLNFENSDNITHALVRGFTGSNGDDLDTDDDGELDSAPWTQVIDCVSLVNSTTSGEAVYCNARVGPPSPFHAYRTLTGWQRGGTAAGTDDTPGVPNAGGPAGSLTLESDGGGPIPTGPALSEIRIDQPGSTDQDEYFELSGPAAFSLDGLSYIVIGDGSAGGGTVEHVTELSGRAVGANGFFVAAEAGFTLGIQNLTTSLNFENSDNVTHLLVRGFTGTTGQQLDTNQDGTLDVTPWTEIVDCVALRETTSGGDPLYCATVVGPDGSFVPGHVFRTSAGWQIGPFGGGQDTPNAPNSGSGGTAGVVASVSVNIAGAAAQIPAGYDQPVFTTVRDGTGEVMQDVMLTFSTSNAAIATVDQFGNISAESAGTVTITATAPNGVSGARTFEILPHTAPTSAQYGDHTAFGVPADADASDDILLARPQFRLSYNATHAGANWVAWQLDATHFGSVDRCECWTADDALPPTAPRVVNFDYTSSGYNRGHMVMSANRTTTLQENATTFLTTNALPQADNNNQGPWLRFENYTNDRARAGAVDVYLIAGGIWSAAPPTLKNAGKVAIPDYTWKVAVFVPRGTSPSSVDSLDELEVIAIKVPNLEGVSGPASADAIRNDPWEDYAVTVDALESETGYDFLALLPEPLEAIVESGDRPPVAHAGGPYTALEGDSFTLDASLSTDPDAGDVLTYSWDLGNGTTLSGATVQASFDDAGTHEVVLTVTDSYGATASAIAIVTIVSHEAAVADLALLVGAEVTDNGARTALGTHLKNALKHLEAGRDAQAVQQLAVFVEQLGVFEANGAVTAETAAGLRADAEALIASIAH